MQTSVVPPCKGLKKREQRRVVHLKAELRSDAGARPAVICNVALHGLMVKCAEAPARGAFVEVRCEGVIVVGRVVWSQGVRFGLRSQDKIDLAALHATRSSASKTSAKRKEGVRAQRSEVLVRAHLLAAEEQSRNAARLVDWLFVTLAAAAAAVFCASAIYSVVSAPLGQAGAALEKHPG
jgi:hypothetical protein